MNILKIMAQKKNLFYAVKIGQRPGIYLTWEECQRNILGYPNATYKKFSSQEKAQEFMALQFKEGDSAAKIYSKFNSGSQLIPILLNGGHQLTPILLNSGRTLEEESIAVVSPSQHVIAESTAEVKNGSSPVEMRNIYTDGASRGNGKSTAVAGYGVFYGEGDKRNIGLPVEGPLQTNSRAELLAIRYALTSIYKDLKLVNFPTYKYRIYTDSHYSMNCFTKWAPTWSKNGWRVEVRSFKPFKRTREGGVLNKGPQSEPKKYKEIAHRDIIQPAFELLKEINRIYENAGLGPLDILYVKAHNGDPGNELADRLANEGADKLYLLR